MPRVRATCAPGSSVVAPAWLAAFANGIDRDINAVRAAITAGWSNGQTEGQITKLKLAKRQMYGRRKLDHLQARLIGSTP